MVALAIGRLVAEAKGDTMPAAFANVDLEAVLLSLGLAWKRLRTLLNILLTRLLPLPSRVGQF